MKLIRLQTDDDNCVFDNTFNAELTIKKGSKIALKNICINKEPGNVSLLGSASDDVVYNTIGTVVRSAQRMNIGEFNASNYNELLQNIENALNAVELLNCETANQKVYTQGLQWKVSLQGQRIVVNCRMANLQFAITNQHPQCQYMIDHTDNNNLVLPHTNLTNTWVEGGATRGDLGQNRVIFNVPFSKSSGAFSAKISSLRETLNTPNAPGTRYGFILGLVSKAKKDAKQSTLISSDYEACIKVKNTDQTTVTTVFNGVAASNAAIQNIAVADIVSIEISKKQLSFCIYQNANGSARQVLQAYDYVPGTDYYPAITIFDAYTGSDANDCRLTEVYFTPDIQSLGNNIQKIANSQLLSMERFGAPPSLAESAQTVFNSDTYLSVATTGTNTQTDGHIDASDPIHEGGGSVDSTAGYTLWYDFSTIPGGRLPGTDALLSATTGMNYKSYRHKEIEHTLTGLVVGHKYILEIVLEDLDEHSSPVAAGGGTVLVYTHATDNEYVKEDAKVYANGVLIGTMTAETGKGSNQTVQSRFSDVEPDSSGNIKVEIALGFVWNVPSSGADNGVPQVSHNTQQGVRLNRVRLHAGAPADNPYNPAQSNTAKETNAIVSDKVAHFLGFTTNSYTEDLTALNGKGSKQSQKPVTFTAESLFEPADDADNFLIEMLSMQLDSYACQDKSGERRSILATIPKADTAGGAVVYDTPQPIFVDINNGSDELIRGIRARVLKSDLTPLQMKGNATMTVLID